MKTLTDSLPPKQVSEFKDLIKLYESKQFKKGIKLADKILEVCSDNPETLSMKGLLYDLTDKQDEGIDMAKKALMKNLKSDICWHLLGIIHRNHKNYKEAVKCYNMALKYEPENSLQIQRDLALLQLQIRDFKGHCITRQKLLQNNPKIPINWVSFAMSYHLLKDYNQTLEVLKSLWKIVENDSDVKKQELNEIVVYWGLVHIENKSYKECLQLLQKYQKYFLDKQSFNQYLYVCYKELKQTDKAISSLRKLIEINPNNSEYYQQEIELKQLNNQQIIEYYEQYLKLEINQKNQFMKLEILKHQDDKSKFIKTLKDFVKPFYRSGIPSLFKKLKQIYDKNMKSEWIEEGLLEIENQIKTNHKIEQDDEEQNNPSLQLWSWMILAQHFDKRRELDKALEYIDMAIKHTSTLVELYLVKAKIHKHMGDSESGVMESNKAAELDKADRYLNNKNIKYLLYNGQLIEAQIMFKEFMLEDGNPHELQTMWYEILTAQKYIQQEEYSKGLRWFDFIFYHFQEIFEDQMDFYTFSMRKYNIKYYLNLIRYEDNLHFDTKFLQTAHSAINALIKYSFHTKLQEQQDENKEQKKLTGGEKKKAKKLEDQKKEEQIKDPNANIIEKQDLNGEKYIQNMKCPIQEAQKWADKIIYLNYDKPKLDSTKNNYVKALQSVFDLSVIQNNYVQMAQVIKKMNYVDESGYEILLRKEQFVTIIEKQGLIEKHKDIIEQIKSQNIDQQIEKLIQQQSFSQSLFKQFINLRRQQVKAQISQTELIKQVNLMLQNKDIHLQLILFLIAFLENYPLVLSESLIDQTTKNIIQQRFPQMTILGKQEVKQEQ